MFSSINSMLELEEVTTCTQTLHLTYDGPGAEQISNLPKVTQPGFKPTSTNSRALAVNHYVTEPIS